MNRRQFLAGLGAGLILPAMPAQAQAPTAPAAKLPDAAIYVVKFISFACNFCRAAENGDSLVQQAVERTGGKISVAPVDTSEGQTYLKERVYFAARALGDEAAARMRKAMFYATQDHGLTFSSLDSINTWLSVNAADWLSDSDRQALLRESAASATDAALGRAIRLAKSAGVDVLPAYVVLQGGEVKAVYDRQGYPSMNDLRDKLVRRINELMPIQVR